MLNTAKQLVALPFPCTCEHASDSRAESDDLKFSSVASALASRSTHLRLYCDVFSSMDSDTQPPFEASTLSQSAQLEELALARLESWPCSDALPSCHSLYNWQEMLEDGSGEYPFLSDYNNWLAATLYNRLEDEVSSRAVDLADPMKGDATRNSWACERGRGPWEQLPRTSDVVDAHHTSKQLLAEKSHDIFTHRTAGCMQNGFEVAMFDDSDGEWRSSATFNSGRTTTLACTGELPADEILAICSQVAAFENSKSALSEVGSQMHTSARWLVETTQQPSMRISSSILQQRISSGIP